MSCGPGLDEAGAHRTWDPCWRSSSSSSSSDITELTPEPDMQSPTDDL